MQIKTVFITILLLSAPGFALENVTCPALFGAEPGLEASSSTGLAVIEEPLYPYDDPAARLLAQVTSSALSGPSPSVKLGEGSYGSVFLEYADSDRRSLRIRKIYIQSHKAATRAQLDVQLLDALNELREDAASLAPLTNKLPGAPTKGSAMAIVEGFHFLRGLVSLSFDSSQHSSDAPSATFTAPYVRGRTVHELMLDENLPIKTREKIEEAYMANFNQLMLMFQHSGILEGAPIVDIPEPRYFKDRQTDSLPALFGKIKVQGQVIDFIVKTDNVVVDPLDLNKQTVIDPY
jgi:hypothetical protein